MKLTLKPYYHKADWIIKSWKVYCGEFYLGKIIKRKVGFGTVIHTGKKEAIAYQCQINLLSDECLCIKGLKPIHKITDLKLAKKEFRKAYKRLLAELTRED